MKSTWKVYGSILGVMSVFGAMPLSAGANLIQNGSFEDSIYSSVATWETLYVGSTAIAGWTVLGTGQTTDSIDYVGEYWEASHGVRSLDLDGRAASGGVEQAFGTSPGTKYNVSFDIAGNPDWIGIKTMEVSAVGEAMQSAIFSFDNTGHSHESMGWTTVEWFFVADAPSTTLRFVSLTEINKGYGISLDNVVVHVPAPGAALLGLLGLGSSGGLLRWRRRANSVASARS